jgi:ankyrin repeat protein
VKSTFTVYPLVKQERVIELLVDRAQVDVNSKDKNGCTLLSLAAQNGLVVAARLFLTTGKVDVNARDKIGRTALSFAAQKCDSDILKLLLQVDGIDVDGADKKNRAPLFWALKQSVEIASFVMSCY